MMQWQLKQQPSASVAWRGPHCHWAESSTELPFADYRFKKLSLVKQMKVNAQQMATQTSRMTTIQPSIPRLQSTTNTVTQSQQQQPVTPDQRLLLGQHSYHAVPAVMGVSLSTKGAGAQAAASLENCTAD